MAALGFGIDGCAAVDAAGAYCSAFLPAGFGGIACAAAAFGRKAGAFTTTFFEGAPRVAFVFLTFAFGASFFADADSSFLSVNSNAGLGRVRSCGTMRVISAAGFTPAAAAARAAAAASAGCFGLPSMSGFAIT